MQSLCKNYLVLLVQTLIHYFLHAVHNHCWDRSLLIILYLSQQLIDFIFPLSFFGFHFSLELLHFRINFLFLLLIENWLSLLLTNRHTTTVRLETLFFIVTTSAEIFFYTLFVLQTFLVRTWCSACSKVIFNITFFCNGAFISSWTSPRSPINTDNNIFRNRLSCSWRLKLLSVVKRGLFWFLMNLQVYFIAATALAFRLFNYIFLNIFMWSEFLCIALLIFVELLRIDFFFNIRRWCIPTQSLLLLMNRSPWRRLLSVWSRHK